MPSGSIKRFWLIATWVFSVLALTVAVDHSDRIRRAVSLNSYDYGESVGGGRVACPSRCASPAEVAALVFGTSRR